MTALTPLMVEFSFRIGCFVDAINVRHGFLDVGRVVQSVFDAVDG